MPIRNTDYLREDWIVYDVIKANPITIRLLLQGTIEACVEYVRNPKSVGLWPNLYFPNSFLGIGLLRGENSFIEGERMEIFGVNQLYPTQVQSLDEILQRKLAAPQLIAATQERLAKEIGLFPAN